MRAAAVNDAAGATAGVTRSPADLGPPRSTHHTRRATDQTIAVRAAAVSDAPSAWCGTRLG